MPRGRCCCASLQALVASSDATPSPCMLPAGILSGQALETLAFTKPHPSTLPMRLVAACSRALHAETALQQACNTWAPQDTPSTPPWHALHACARAVNVIIGCPEVVRGSNAADGDQPMP